MTNSTLAIRVPNPLVCLTSAETETENLSSSVVEPMTHYLSSSPERFLSVYLSNSGPDPRNLSERGLKTRRQCRGKKISRRVHDKRTYIVEDENAQDKYLPIWMRKGMNKYHAIKIHFKP